MSRPRMMRSLSERIRKAGEPDVWVKLDALANQYSPEIRQTFLDTLHKAKQGVSPSSLVNALASGNVELVVTLLLGNLDKVREYWFPFIQAARTAVVGPALTFSLNIGTAGKIAVNFDQYNPRSIAEIQRYSLNLIREIDDRTRAGIREYVRASLEEGRNPRDLITQLAGRVGEDGVRSGGILGLTDRQARAVSNYRRGLHNLDRFTLERALRDKRFDATVERAIANREPLAAEYIEKLVRRYESNYLAYRAETVARTESLRALGVGQKLAWDSAIENGFDRGRLIKTWWTALDERVRAAHSVMHGVEVEYDEMFEPEDTGPIWGPPEAPNCRCVAFIRPAIRRVV